MAEKIKIGAKAEIKGERMAFVPRELKIAMVNQKIMEMATAMPIP